MGEMPLDVAKAAIEKYASERDACGRRILLEVIPSTMGEPLLYSQFDGLLELCGTLEIPINLTTNGTFPGTWGSEDGMAKLLRACSDIKVSYLASEQFDGWKANVKKMLNVRSVLIAGLTTAKPMPNARTMGLANVSLQVTLHKRNLKDVPELVPWASAIGIGRIKWNPVVFLDEVSFGLREMYEIDSNQLENLRDKLRTELRSQKLEHEGSLFFDRSAGLCPVGGMCESCPFEDEVWIWPDGHEDHCPNPERRWGNI